MSGAAGTFAGRSGRALADEHLRGAVARTVDRLRSARERATAPPLDWPALRAQAGELRARTLRDLDRHLARFRTSLEAHGGVFRRARDAAEARAIVVEVARARGLTLAAKSKSMLGEEIEVNGALSAAGVEPVETDLGEWIVQLAGEAPAHIILPAIHKRRAAIRALFEREGARGIGESTADLAGFARARLRERFLAAGLGISGCNFAVAETGSVAIFTNEGNGRMVTTLPRVHVVLLGIERIVPALADLELLSRVLPRAATGQRLTTYLNVITGPRRAGEVDGPEELIVVAIDNGRARIAADARLAPVLACVRCGACLNVCPVYRQVGGHAYGSVYPGPIGAVLAGLLEPDAPARTELAQASTLCGACTDACPVGIPLHDLLVRARQERRARGHAPLGERMAMAAARRVLKSRSSYVLAGAALRRLAPLARRAPPLAAWHRHRAPLPIARRSFRELWDAGLEREVVPVRERVPLPRAPDRPRPTESEAPVDRVERFAAALAGVGASCRRVRSASELDAALRALVAGRTAAAWDAAGFADLGLAETVGELAACRAELLDPAAFRAACAAAEVGLTTVACAVAETGSLALACAPSRPRAVSLLPPVHVAVVRASQLVDTPREVFERAGALPSQLVLVTGPSRTSDIENDLTIGVHGPAEVHVLVLEGA